VNDDWYAHVEAINQHDLVSLAHDLSAVRQASGEPLVSPQADSSSLETLESG
jgi:hypothetical protein